MKLSFALIASSVFATQPYQYVSVSEVATLGEAACFDSFTTPIGSGETNPMGAVLAKSFETFPLPTEVAVKVLAAPNTGTQSFEINVTISRDAWTNFEEVTAVRSKALLNVVGTLNLVYDEPNRPWKAKITMKTLNTGDKFPVVIPDVGTYSRPSDVITTAQKRVLKQTGCNTPFPK
jgi:hypothetical protein